MNDLETQNMAIPFLVTVIPAYIVGVLSLTLGITGVLVLGLALLAHFSMNYVRDTRVPYLNAYKKALVAAIVMLLVAHFFFRVILLYIVLSVFVVFYLVFSTLRERETTA